MSLFINSPSYYTQIHGIDDDVYKMCRLLEKAIDIKKYTSLIDTVGITPIIAKDSKICDGKWNELKHISLAYRMASISLRIDYEKYIASNIEEKKMLIINNIFSSLLVVKKRLKDNFDYEKIKNDILESVGFSLSTKF